MGLRSCQEVPRPKVPARERKGSQSPNVLLLLGETAEECIWPERASRRQSAKNDAALCHDTPALPAVSIEIRTRWSFVVLQYRIKLMWLGHSDRHQMIVSSFDSQEQQDVEGDDGVTGCLDENGC